MSVESQPDKNVPQRTHEWVHIEPERLGYHTGQWDQPKQSTKAFERFMGNRLQGAKRVIDLACGAGAATAFLAQHHRAVRFTGIDYASELISIAQRITTDRAIANLEFRTGDWFALEPQECDGVVSLQTLSWLPEYERPLVEIFQKLKPSWIGLTSLFYEGDITCWIQAEEHRRGQKYFYNVYSLPAIERLCQQHGYRLADVEAFQIDIDLPQPTNRDVLGTYTRRVVEPDTSEITRLQISGPMLMNWKMLRIERL